MASPFSRPGEPLPAGSERTERTRSLTKAPAHERGPGRRNTCPWRPRCEAGLKPYVQSAYRPPPPTTVCMVALLQLVLILFAYRRTSAGGVISALLGRSSAVRRVVFDTISPDALLRYAILGRSMGLRNPILDQDEQGVPPFIVRQTIRRVDCAGEPGLWGDSPAAAGALRHRLPKGRNPLLGPPDRTCALACLHPPAQETANLWFFGPTYYGVDVGWTSKWREMQRLPALASQGLRYGSLPATPPS